jgi:hypothetical protein
MYKKSFIGIVMSDLDPIVEQPGTGNMTEPARSVRPRPLASAFGKRWIKWVVAFALVPWNPASARVISDGYTPLGTWSPSIGTSQYGPYSANTALNYSWGWKLAAWQSTPSDSNGATCNIAGQPYVTVDGWSGYQIQPGVLIILTGTLTAATNTGSPNATANLATDNYSASWDSKGAITADWLSPGATSHCAGLRRTLSGNFYALTGGSATMNVSYGVYVSPSAAAGSLPTTYLQLHKTSGSNQQSVLNFSNLTIARTQCTLDTPPVIHFGDVTPSQTSSGDGIKVQSSLGVNCTNEAGAPTAISYSFTPKSRAGDEYTFPMTLVEGGGIVGDIRGFLGANAATDAGCATNASSVPMNSTKVELRSISGNEIWSEPLVWVLCPKATVEPGRATAAGTIDVYW